MRRLRDLSLNVKLTLALLGVFGASAAAFLLLLRRSSASRPSACWPRTHAW